MTVTVRIDIDCAGLDLAGLAGNELRARTKRNQWAMPPEAAIPLLLRHAPHLFANRITDAVVVEGGKK